MLAKPGIDFMEKLLLIKLDLKIEPTEKTTLSV
jgi:hypothetical protein